MTRLPFLVPVLAVCAACSSGSGAGASTSGSDSSSGSGGTTASTGGSTSTAGTSGSTGSSSSSTTGGSTSGGTSSGTTGSAAGQILLFGGIDGDITPTGPFDAGILGDTWTYDGTRWTQHQVSGPPPRYASVAGATPQGVVLFGGESFEFPDAGPPIGDDLQNDSDTWVWDGASWTFHDVSGPTPRALSQGASLNGAFYLYGGYGGATGSGINDLWTWDGQAWTLLVPEQHPVTDARPTDDVSLAVATYRSALFFSDGLQSWTWNGSAWAAVDGGTNAPNLSGHAAVLNDQLIYFGNAGGTSQTWAWDGTRWTQLQPTTEPPARNGFGMAALPGKVVMFGGAIPADDGGVAYLGDTWIFDGTTWTLQTGAGPSPRSATIMVAY